MCEPRRGILRNSNMDLAALIGTTVPRDPTTLNWKHHFAMEKTKAQRESHKIRSDIQLWDDDKTEDQEQEDGDDRKENNSKNLVFSPRVYEHKEDPSDEMLSLGKPTGTESDCQNCSSSSMKEHSLRRSWKVPSEFSDDHSPYFHDLSALVRKMYQVVEKSRHLDAKIAEINKESLRLLSDLERRKTK